MLDQSKYDGYAEDFKIGYDLALQQKTSRFKDKVSWAAAVKGDGAQVVDHILPFEAEVGGGDFEDTKWTHPEMAPRWAFPVPIRVAVPVGTTDRLSMLSDPSNELTKSIIAAQNRALDGKIIVPSFFRDVTGGKDKDKTHQFAAGQIIDKDVGAANSGINRDKIDNAIEIFETNEVDLDEEMPWMAITPRQHRILRNLSEVKNRDFEKMGGVMKDGKVTQFLGCRVFVSNRLTKVKVGAVTYVEMPIWVPSGIAVQPWLEPNIQIGVRADKNYTTQLFCEARYGAIRTEEGRVIKVMCNEEALPGG